MYSQSVIIATKVKERNQGQNQNSAVSLERNAIHGPKNSNLSSAIGVTELQFASAGDWVQFPQEKCGHQSLAARLPTTRHRLPLKA